MNTETLDKAISIKREMADVERILNVAEKNKAVDLSFSLGGFCCSSLGNPFISPEEVDDMKRNINELIRMRAQARLDELQKEFDNL